MLKKVYNAKKKYIYKQKVTVKLLVCALSQIHCYIDGSKQKCCFIYSQLQQFI